MLAKIIERAAKLKSKKAATTQGRRGRRRHHRRRRRHGVARSPAERAHDENERPLTELGATDGDPVAGFATGRLSHRKIRAVSQNVKEWKVEVVVTSDCDRLSADGSRTVIHNRITTTYEFARRVTRSASRNVERPGVYDLPLAGGHRTAGQTRRGGKLRVV